MTQYEKPSFTVPVGKRPAAVPCTHDWLTPKGECVFCGERPPQPEAPS